MMFVVAHESDSQWDDRLDRVSIATTSTDRIGAWTPYNYSGWARVKALDGWQPIRLNRADGSPLTQVLVRKKGGVVAAAYCPGGFLGAEPVNAAQFSELLRATLHVRVLYARVHMLTPTKFVEPALEGVGWHRARSMLSSGRSLKLRLDASEEQRQESLSFNWRRNLRRGERHENIVSVVERPNATEIASLHDELEQLKGDHVNTWESSLPHVERLIEGFGSRLVVVKCVSEQGNLRAIRGAIITGGCAYDMLASTSAEGRKHYSSYVTFWALANELARRGVVRYDLGGVDEVKNRGVFDFKNGTGAMDIHYGGEFEAAIPSATRGLLSSLISRLR